MHELTTFKSRVGKEKVRGGTKLEKNRKIEK